MKFKPFYKNRKDAASKLVTFLKNYKNSDTVILSIPNGGIPIGNRLSKELKLPLYFVPIKKIKHPDSDDVNIGALSINHTIIDPHMGIEENAVSQQIKNLRAELKEEIKSKDIQTKQISLKNKNIILTDDGVTTGSTMLATLQLIQKENPAKKILAVPVATSRSLQKLHDYVDEIVCLHMPESVENIAGYYENFDSLSDRDLESILAK